PRPPRSPLFPYTTLFRSGLDRLGVGPLGRHDVGEAVLDPLGLRVDGQLLGEDVLILDADLVLLPLRLTFPLENLALGGLGAPPRSEEHTSELQSLRHLVC